MNFERSGRPFKPRPKEKSSSVLTHRANVRIEWGDCDPAGTVLLPYYLNYEDACTNALLAMAGLFKPVMLKTYDIIRIPLVDFRARFIVPSDIGDEVIYETSVADLGGEAAFGPA